MDHCPHPTNHTHLDPIPPVHLQTIRPARHGRLSRIRDNGRLQSACCVLLHMAQPRIFGDPVLQPEGWCLNWRWEAGRHRRARVDFGTRHAYGADQSVSRDHWACSTMRSPALPYPSHVDRSKRLHKLPHSRWAVCRIQVHRHAFLPLGLDRRDLRRPPSAPVRSGYWGSASSDISLGVVCAPYAHKAAPPLTGDASGW